MRLPSGFALFVLAFAPIFAAAQPLLLEEPTDYDDFNQTMVALERVFLTRNETLLDDITTDRFHRTSLYRRLKESVGCCGVNSSYSSRASEQVFVVGRDELTIRFVYRDKKWVIADAFVNGKRPPDRGFSSLAAQFFFSDFRDMITSGNAGRLSGLAPYGRLNPRFFQGKKIVSRGGTTITFLNLILHDGTSARELFFVTLRQFSEVNEKRRGWLIDDGDTMLSHRINEGKDPLLEFLTGGPAAFDLTRESAFHYVNAASSEAERKATEVVATHRVSRTRVSHIDMSDHDVTRVTVTLDLVGPPIPHDQFQVSLQGGVIIVRGSGESTFTTNASHSYLAVRTSGQEIRIDVKKVPAAPFSSFVGGTIGGIATNLRDKGFSLNIPITLPR